MPRLHGVRHGLSSGVQYDSLLEAARPQVERDAARPFGDRLFRRLVFATFPHPGRLQWLTRPLALYQKLGLQRLVHQAGLGRLLPSRVQAMERLLPTVAWRNEPLPAIVPAEGKARRRVALLTGCVQRVFFGDVNRATARVLAAEGCDVIVPQNQECCGALAEHAGEEEMAKVSARRLIDVFDAAHVDTIVINAAGCGSAMKRYGHLLRNDPRYKARAEAFAAKCRDVSEILLELEPRVPRGPVAMKVAYHDACHLQHAQGVRAQPRKLLQEIPGIELKEIAESEICCGSAGIYNLLEPEAAADLRTRKVSNVAKTGADMVVSGNPGCLLQIAAGLEATGRPLPVMHLVEVIDRSIAAGRATRTA